VVGLGVDVVSAHAKACQTPWVCASLRCAHDALHGQLQFPHGQPSTQGCGEELVGVEVVVVLDDLDSNDVHGHGVNLGIGCGS